jgi:hypothetical protein
LLAEIAKFIPYFLTREDEEFGTVQEGQSQAILSSYVLSSWVGHFWFGYRQKRRHKMMEIAQELRELRNGRFDQEFSRTRKRYSLLCDLDWFWENPEKEEDTLCVLCMNIGQRPTEFWNCRRIVHSYHRTCFRETCWTIRNKSEFKRCYWGIHTLHKDCKDDFDLCPVCSPLWDQH